MRRTALWRYFLLVLLLAPLMGCGNREKGAELLLEQAEASEQQGDSERAEALYRQVLSDFSGTAAVGTAQARLGRLEHHREIVQDPLDTLFESLELVLDGYRSLYGAYPRTPGEIDTSGYMFDSSYMAEQVPEGLEVYVGLGEKRSPYRIWILPKGGGEGAVLEGPGQEPIPTPREALIALLGNSLVESARKGEMVFLAPPEVAGK